ncbi:lytic polysaccharide monooxygenase [Isoptericola halotolerans]|uniref:Carbohydrate-binding protein with CBM5 and CBM33 domain n=1 Tax=Isoptericola halotolerans TaxID=300560 RepID=A0ABX2A9Y5_9MICO|nr:lytic polysaccharide monooxygenase [Isoptericola halotolerans]NOV98837.1 putative carbohydrate-binding protein with CBM5 and CBM33 domain [Isoptericola halotolerans]
MRWRTALVTAVTGLVALLAPLAVAPTAAAHGWVTNPPSRQDHCANGTVSFDCGGIQYEPQSVEAPKGSMECSGGSGFDVLDDATLAWPRTAVDSSVTMRWQLTARHATSTWEYFVDGVLHRTFDDGGAQPGAVVEHTLDSLPAGDHTILARWNVADTPMAFYACVDVTVGGGSGSDPDPDPEPDPEPGECEAAAWDPAAVYLNGDQVSHDGRTYQAAWWTRGEDPASAGEWGVWRDLGAC